MPSRSNSLAVSLGDAADRPAAPVAVATASRSALVPRLRAWHHALGAALAWLLLVASVTGVALVYKNEIIRLTVAGGAIAPAEGYSRVQLAEDLDQITARYPVEHIQRLNAPVEERPYWTLVGTDGQSRVLELGTLNERTDFNWVLSTLDLLRAVHIDLMLHTLGDWILLVLGLIVVFFTVSGLVMWWPARRHFKPARLLPSKFSRQHLLISHRQLGVLLAPVIVLAAITGSVMIGNGFVYRAINALSEPATSSDSSPGDLSSDSARESAAKQRALPPSQLLTAAFQAVPDARVTLVYLPKNPADDAVFRMRLPGEWHPNGRTRVPVNASTGEVGAFDRSDEAGAGRRLLNQMYPLHSSYGLHPVFRFCVFLGGVVTVWLAVSGFSSWVKRRRRRSLATRAKSARQ